MAKHDIRINNVRLIELSVMVQGQSTSRTAMMPGEWQDFEQVAVNAVHRLIKKSGLTIDRPVPLQYKTQPETCADGKLHVRVIVQ